MSYIIDLVCIDGQKMLNKKIRVEIVENVNKFDPIFVFIKG